MLKSGRFKFDVQGRKIPKDSPDDIRLPIKKNKLWFIKVFFLSINTVKLLLN